MMTFAITQQTMLWAYGILHVAFGLVTHYHSVAQVRRWNKTNHNRRISAWKMGLWFCGRMIWGLPIFVIAHIVSPIGNRWHMTPRQIKEYKECKECKEY